MPKIALATEQWTWDAVSVGQGAAEIALHHVQVRDHTAKITYDTFLGHVMPFDIPFGHEMYGHFGVQNIGDITIWMDLLIIIRDPDGIEIFNEWSGVWEVGVGTTLCSGQPSAFVLDKPGIWTIYGRAEYDTVPW